MGSVCEPFYKWISCSDKGSVMFVWIVDVKPPRVLAHHMALIMLQSTISRNCLKLHFNPQITPPTHGGKRNSKKFHVNKILEIFSWLPNDRWIYFFHRPPNIRWVTVAIFRPWVWPVDKAMYIPCDKKTYWKIIRKADAMILEKCRMDFGILSWCNQSFFTIS